MSGKRKLRQRLHLVHRRDQVVHIARFLVELDTQHAGARRLQQPPALVRRQCDVVQQPALGGACHGGNTHRSACTSVRELYHESLGLNGLLCYDGVNSRGLTAVDPPS